MSNVDLISRQIEQLKIQLRALEDTLFKEKKDVEIVEVDLKRTLRRRESAEQTIHSTKQRISEWENKLKLAEQELYNLESDQSDLENRLKDEEQEYEELKEEVRKTREELDSLGKN